MTKRKPIPWLEIKAEYLKGCSPKELSIKYNVPAKTIHEKASKESWVDEKASISKKVQESIENYIKTLSKKALKQLETVIDDTEAEYKDKVSASRAILDVSGLKSSKHELTGNVGVEKVYITKEEEKQVQNHIDDFIDG